ncbi:hypothetical protein SAMN04488059_11124 [Devosia psychrophila]|uniref:Uncharacterized protein n=1 Tax=Devosia psychrophila TaxID=728005 RepID=A0A1I1LYE9_9HYPH|nr:hypothetical protein SAMN04488059_11124 [Devosia psychrophila]
MLSQVGMNAEHLRVAILVNGHMRSVGLLVGAVVIIAGGAAFAQTASQVTPQTFQP